MKNDRTFYKCNACGNVASLLTVGGGALVCCGQEMQALKPNTTDAAQEKHVPAVTRDGNNLSVQVGSVAHPMTEEHHIGWIVVAQGNRTKRVALAPTDAPKAEFLAHDGDVTVYEYCNLHGLWAVDA